MKRLSTLVLVALASLGAWAQGVKPLPSLHVEGKWIVDKHGNHVVLHGVMDTPNMYFNGWNWGSPWTGVNYDANGVTKCKNYFHKLFGAFEQAKCTLFRLHLDPAWTNDPSDAYTYEVASSQPTNAEGEADIKKFNPERLKSFMKSLYFPLAKDAMNHGQFVIMRPPGVCPRDLKVGDYYQQYLLEVWDIVSKNDSVQKYAGQISLELANEPINIRNKNNIDAANAMRDYFQPIVNKIRENGFTGIIWIPGTGYQSNYRGYKTYPITDPGNNFGYAVHDYPGWYNSSDDNPDPVNKRNNFLDAVPVVNTKPIVITEVDWSPLKEPLEFDHYNEWGQPVYKNLGTWATATTSKWGKAFKAMLDYFGNISMTLTHPHDFLDIDTLLKKNKVVAAFNANPEACGKACMDWYAEYYKVDWPHADVELPEEEPSLFPFEARYMDLSMGGAAGVYNEKNHAMRPSADGQIGWTYAASTDMSGYKYLVVKLRDRQTCDARLNIYTDEAMTEGFTSDPFGDETLIAIDLTKATYTTGTKQGQPLDLKNVRAVGFSGSGKGIMIVTDMYLTNNDDYSPQPAGIHQAFADPSQRSRLCVVTIAGQCIKRSNSYEEAIQGLPAGIYIINGKKVLVK